MLPHQATITFLFICISFFSAHAQGLSPEKCITVDKEQFEQIFPMLDANGQLLLNYEQSPNTIKNFNSDLTSSFGGSIALYKSWLDSGAPVALQMYAKGGHGFGMRKQGLPSDSWAERLYEWMLSQGLVE